MAGDDRPGAPAADDAAGPAAARQPRRAGGDGDERLRQADRRVARRRRQRGADDRILRRHGAARDRRDAADPARPARLHAARAARRLRLHRALELPAGDRGSGRWRRRWRPATPSCSSRPATRRRRRIRLGELALEAGFPPGVLNVITGPGSVIGRALAEHPDVDKIAFTGETETGREIQALAAGTIKKVSLELGGKSPNIVFPDADIEAAVNGSLLAIYGNAGQRCTARTRLLLHEGATTSSSTASSTRPNRIRIGDPLLDRDADGAARLAQPGRAGQRPSSPRPSARAARDRRRRQAAGRPGAGARQLPPADRRRSGAAGHAHRPRRRSSGRCWRCCRSRTRSG